MKRSEVYKKIEEHYRANYEGLIKQYRAQTKSLHMAEDIVQEGYTRACEYWDTYDLGNFDGWIKIIIHNSSKKIRNEERAHGAVIVSTPAPEPLVNSPVEARDELRTIAEQIDGKPGSIQRILRLTLIEQCKYVDVAKELGVSKPYITQVVQDFRASL